MTDIYFTFKGEEKASKVETAWIIEDPLTGDYDMYLKTESGPKMLPLKSAKV